MESHKFEIEPKEEYRKERGCFGGCLKGCFIVLLVFVLIVVLFAFLVANNWRDWAASAGEYFLDDGLAATNLPENEQNEIKQELRRPFQALRDGKLSIAQFEELVEVMLESPLLPSLAVTVVETQYFAKSHLTPEEQQAGSITLHRFIRGVINQQIDEATINQVISQVADREEDGKWRFRENVTDEELRRMIASAAQAADQAGIPPQVEQVDPSNEVRKVIDAVMGPPEPAPAQ